MEYKYKYLKYKNKYLNQVAGGQKIIPIDSKEEEMIKEYYDKTPKPMRPQIIHDDEILEPLKQKPYHYNILLYNSIKYYIRIATVYGNKFFYPGDKNPKTLVINKASQDLIPSIVNFIAGFNRKDNKAIIDSLKEQKLLFETILKGTKDFTFTKQDKQLLEEKTNLDANEKLRLKYHTNVDCMTKAYYYNSYLYEIFNKNLPFPDFSHSEYLPELKVSLYETNPEKIKEITALFNKFNPTLNNLIQNFKENYDSNNISDIKEIMNDKKSLPMMFKFPDLRELTKDLKDFMYIWNLNISTLIHLSTKKIDICKVLESVRKLSDRFYKIYLWYGSLYTSRISKESLNGKYRNYYKDLEKTYKSIYENIKALENLLNDNDKLKDFDGINPKYKNLEDNINDLSNISFYSGLLLRGEQPYGQPHPEIEKLSKYNNTSSPAPPSVPLDLYPPLPPLPPPLPSGPAPSSELPPLINVHPRFRTIS